MIRELICEYKEESSKTFLILPRAIYRYWNRRDFRIKVDIRNMLNTKNLYLKKRRREKLATKFSIEVGLNATIGKNLFLPHPEGIVIGDKVSIGDNCTIYQGVTLGNKNKKYPTIGDNVTIYPLSIIVGDISIESNAVIGAGSVVLHNVHSNEVVAGNPARVIKYINQLEMNDVRKGDGYCVKENV